MFIDYQVQCVFLIESKIKSSTCSYKINRSSFTIFFAGTLNGRLHVVHMKHSMLDSDYCGSVIQCHSTIHSDFFKHFFLLSKEVPIVKHEYCWLVTQFWATSLIDLSLIVNYKLWFWTRMCLRTSHPFFLLEHKMVECKSWWNI
jgi:hypothetical protein